MLIRGADIVTGNGVFRGDILVEGESIVAVGKNLSGGGPVIDADGLLALPGGVDVHTHMDLDTGSARASDDFFTGTVAAACGGTTTIVDHMGFGPEGCALRHQVDSYHALADGRAVVDYGFHGVLQHVNAQVLEDMEALIAEGITSYKAYLTYAYKLSDAEIFQVLRRCRDLGIMLTVHPENDGVVNFLREEFQSHGCAEPRYHPLSRPDTLEAEAVGRMLLLAHQAGDAPLYIVHLTNALALSLIQAARERGQRHVYAETCPQYLLLDDSRYGDSPEGLRFICSPPLRKPEDQEALWQGLAKGAVQTVATDHCPFTMEQKMAGAADFTRSPNGMPGVELRMALLHSEGVEKGRFSLSHYAQITSALPARLFGLEKKGALLPGKDADILLLDPAKKMRVTRDILHERVDYTPYEGMECRGWPVMTIARGEIIAKEGNFIGKEGRGRFQRRFLPIL